MPLCRLISAKPCVTLFRASKLVQGVDSMIVCASLRRCAACFWIMAPVSVARPRATPRGSAPTAWLRASLMRENFVLTT